MIPVLIKKFVDAVRENRSKVEVWGTGAASREFLYIDDAARGVVLATKRYNKPDPVNLGAGKEISIKELVSIIQEYTGFTGTIRWDTSRPDEQPRRCLVTSRAAQEFGFKAQVPFEEGLKRTIKWYFEASR